MEDWWINWGWESGGGNGILSNFSKELDHRGVEEARVVKFKGKSRLRKGSFRIKVLEHV